MSTLYTNFKWWRTGEPQEMLVEDGRVVYRRATPNPPPPPNAGKVDLQGKTLYPAFIDNHCHILPTGLDLQKLYLGGCTSNEHVLDSVRDALKDVPAGKWLLAVHYDQTRYGGMFLTREDLDVISARTPILLRHVNGHAGVANSAALKAAGVADDAEDPQGGSFGRFADGRVNGVLFETAQEYVDHHAPLPTAKEMGEAILLAARKMSDLGIGCASDMMTGRFDLFNELEAYRIASEQGCDIATRLYLQWGEVFKKDGSWKSDEVREAVQGYRALTSRIGGIKIFADGAIGSATAAIYGNYSGQPAAGHSISRSARKASQHAPDNQQVSGQLIYSPERLNDMVRIAHEAGFQIAIHSIGDYSTDLVMDAYEQLGDAKRHRIEHAMLLSDEQIARMAKIGCHCCMQPEFLLRFGHSYLRQLGPERTSKLKRFRSIKDAGIPLSLSSDRPIVAGDPMDGVRVAVNRPEGFDSKENLTWEEAIDAYTVGGAKANEDGEEIGGLETGQLAVWRVGSEGTRK